MKKEWGREMIYKKFKQDDVVLVHSLDDSGKTYEAVVCGVAVNYGESPATIYILRAVDPIDEHYEYSHYTMPAACILRKG